MARPLAQDKTTRTDLQVYWRDSPFANLSGLMRLGNFTREEAEQFIEQCETTPNYRRS